MTTLARHTKSIQKTPRRTRPAQRVAVAPFAKGCIGPTSTKPRMQSPRTDTAGDFFLKGLLLDTKLFCLYIYALKAQLLSSTNFHQHALIGGSSGVYWHISTGISRPINSFVSSNISFSQGKDDNYRLDGLGSGSLYKIASEFFLMRLSEHGHGTLRERKRRCTL